MGTTNRAEEYADNKLTPKAKEYAVTSSIRAVYDNCIEDFNAGFNSRQSEIDELTKEVERLRKEREWISVYRSDIKPPIDTPILCKQKAKDEKFTYLILGFDKNGEFRDFNNDDYIDAESELYTEGHYPYIEFWQPLPPTPTKLFT